MVFDIANIILFFYLIWLHSSIVLHTVFKQRTTFTQAHYVSTIKVFSEGEAKPAESKHLMHGTSDSHTCHLVLGHLHKDLAA